MVKKVDFKLGEFNLDAGLSLDDFDFDLPESKPQGRKPLNKVVKGVKKGFKTTVLSDQFIEKAVKDTLPKGFGAAYDLGMDSYTAFNNLYNTAARDVAPHLKDIKRTARRYVPEVEQYSKKWADRLRRITEEDRGFDYRMMSASEYREQNNQRELTELFALSQETQNARDEEAIIREQIRDGMDQRRHRDNLEQLNSVRLGIQQLVSYQNKITINYQRKHLELQYRILGVQTDMLESNAQFYQETIKRLDAVVSNTALPDFVKLTNSERLSDAMRTSVLSSFTEGMIGDRKRFVQDLGARLSSKVRTGIGMAGMGLTQGLMRANMSLDDKQLDRDLGIDSGGAYGAAGRMVGGALPNFLSESVGRRIRSRLNRTRGIGRASNEAQYIAENYMQMLTEWARGTRGESGRITDPLVRGVKNSILEGRARRDVQIDSISGLQKPMPYNRAANKAIIEIIPGLLTNIHHELKIMRTGDVNTPKTVYDYSKNKFGDEGSARANMMNRIIDKRDRESVRRDIDTLIDRVDPNKTLTGDARVQLGRQLLRDNLENRLASPEALQQSRRYSGGARQYASEYTKLFGEYFKGDRNAERKLEFAQAYGGLGRYIQTGRSTVQDMVNLGLGDMLDQTGVLPNDSRGNINMERMYQYYYGEPDAMPGVTGASGQVNQMGTRLNYGSGGMGGSDGIIATIQQTSMASTQAIVEAIHSLQGQMVQGVRTVTASEEMMGAPAPDNFGAAPSASTASSYGTGFGSSKSFKMPNFTMPSMPSMSMPSFNMPGMPSMPNFGGFAAGASSRASAAGGRLKGFFSKMRKNPILRLGRGGFNVLRMGRDFANSAVSQGLGTAASIGMPVLKHGGRFAGMAGLFGLSQIPNALKLGRNFANGVVNDVQGSLGRVGGFLNAGFNKAMAQDVFSAESGRKLVSAATLRTGQILSAVTGKPVTKPEDIDGPLVDAEGNEILSQEDLDGGLIDSSGRAIRSAFLRTLSGIGAAGASAGGLGLKAARFLASGVDQGIGNAASIAKNTVGKLFKFGKQGIGSGSAVEILIQIRDMLNERMGGKKTKFDASGDGLRDGSYESIKKAREAKKREKETGKAEGAAASGGGLLAALSRIFGGKKSEEGEESKDGDNVFIGGGGEGSDKKGEGKGKKPAPKGFWGKTKHMGGRVLGGIGALATGALGLLGIPTGLVTGAAKMAGKAVTGTARLGFGALRLAGMGIAGLTSLIGLPALLGIGAVGAGIYGAVKFFSGRLKMKPLNIMRYAQYGFLPEDEDKIKAVFEFEKMLLKAVKFDGGMPELDQTKIDMVEAVKLFGINPEDESQVRPWGAWLQRRFKPVFLTSVAVLKRVSGGTDLNDVDDLEDEKKKRYFDGASFPSGPYDYMTGPFPGEALRAGPGEVKKYTEEAKATLKDGKPTQADSKGTGATAATAAAATVVTAGTIAEETRNIQQDKQEGRRNKMADKMMPAMSITPESLISRTPPAGAVSVVGALPPGMGDNTGQVNALKAIRWRTYGLREMEYDKSSVLAALEQEIAKDCVWDGKANTKWSGSPANVAQKWAASFGVSIEDVDAMVNWTQWFNIRFLPVLTTYMSYLKKATDKDTIELGEAMLKPLQSYEAGLVLQTAKTMDGDDLKSVWAVRYSPWPGYRTSWDIKSIQPNLDYLKDKASKVTLDEQKKTDTGSGSGGGKSETEKAAEDDRPWWKFWGGDKKPTQVFDPNNPKAGDPGGFTSNAGGAAFGYGRKGHEQTSPGAAGASVAAGGAGVVGANGTISGGNAAGAMTDGTGGKFMELPNPNGEGTAASMQDLITAAAKMVGVDPNLMMTMAAIESGFRPAIKAPTSSATGLYQFITSTWKETVRKHGNKYGISENVPPTDPKANALMGAEFIKDNMKALQGTIKGRPITDTDLYVAHFLGAGGAKQLLGADPNAIAAQLMPAPARANKSIFFQGERPRTVAEVYQVLNTLVQRKGKQFGLQAGGASASAMRSSGSSTDSAPSVTSAPQETGGGGGYESSVTAAYRPVEQTPGAVGAGGLAGSNGGPTSTGGSGTGPGLPVADVPSIEQRGAQQASIASRQQDLSAQQEANGKNMAASMGGLDETAKQLVKINADQLTVLMAIKDILDKNGGIRGSSPASDGPRPPANANPTATTSNRSSQFPRPSDSSPVDMKRRYA